MTDGFTAIFSKADISSNTYQWKSNISGVLIHIKNALFSMTNTITVIDDDITEEKITLLSFLAQHLLILKGRRKQSSY
jgi:1,4-dihydroxy-2-naphthoate octaprenyltransferase